MGSATPNTREERRIDRRPPDLRNPASASSSLKTLALRLLRLRLLLLMRKDKPMPNLKPRHQAFGTGSRPPASLPRLQPSPSNYKPKIKLMDKPKCNLKHSPKHSRGADADGIRKNPRTLEARLSTPLPNGGTSRYDDRAPPTSASLPRDRYETRDRERERTGDRCLPAGLDRDRDRERERERYSSRDRYPPSMSGAPDVPTGALASHRVRRSRFPLASRPRYSTRRSGAPTYRWRQTFRLPRKRSLRAYLPARK
ncbi:hypothetical protein B0H15DRAFT_950328 [Mycena belliarum]|uniref:Uncharacterized protein n=1 Tax=Mycena belliarum TaxID=1033014 RepID=A0AAD6U701_9AGAR|nr:hypothetical protein B0H15DRAFT_950328 [Mycena belliae]